MPTDRPMPRFWSLQLMGWSGYFVAMAFSRIGRYPLSYMFAEKFVLSVLGVGISLALRQVLRRMLRTQRSMAALVVSCVIASYVLAAVWTATANLSSIPIEAFFFGKTSSYTSTGALFGGTVYNSFTLVAWGFLYLGLNHYAALQDERERVLRAEGLLAESRLRALQYQLNPHLFFNTLNAISTLVAEHRNSDATLMIARLGDFLRSTLRQDIAPMVPLSDELAFAAQYLDIEQVRFGERLTVTRDIDEDAYRAMVPAFLLQPLIENAARHGIAHCDAGGTISISARVIGNSLTIGVENTVAVHGAAGVGIGLANVRERLTVLYADKFHLETSDRAEGLFRVDIQLPLDAHRPR